MCPVVLVFLSCGVTALANSLGYRIQKIQCNASLQSGGMVQLLKVLFRCTFHVYWESERAVPVIKIIIVFFSLLSLDFHNRNFYSVQPQTCALGFPKAIV